VDINRNDINPPVACVHAANKRRRDTQGEDQYIPARVYARELAIVVATIGFFARSRFKFRQSRASGKTPGINPARLTAPSNSGPWNSARRTVMR
jgi:hypothetical protein